VHDNINRPKHITPTATRLQADANTTAAITSYCGRPDRKGNDWRCNCPICGRHSLIISNKLKYSQVFCFHCKDAGLNDGWTEQRQHFVQAGLIDPNERPKPQTREEIEAEDAEQRTLANVHWDHPNLRPTVPENEAGKYLRARCLEAFIGHPALRFALYGGWNCGPVPCLVSRVLHVRRGLSAVQYTPLLWSGSGRDKEFNRKTIGVRKGGAVWINNPRPDEEVVIAEGLETLLSALLILNLRCGAAVLGTDFVNLVLPASAQRIVIAADNDEVGRSTAAHGCRFLRRGRQARVIMPASEGQDFNDVWVRNVRNG
jgi:hypothetical protein